MVWHDMVCRFNVRFAPPIPSQSAGQERRVSKDNRLQRQIEHGKNKLRKEEMSYKGGAECRNICGKTEGGGGPRWRAILYGWRNKRSRTINASSFASLHGIIA